MDGQSVEKLSELLNEEKWTRATLNNYIIKNFTDLDAIITQAKHEGRLSEIHALCSDHLKHTPNSIIALYVIGKLNFEEEALDEGHIQKLVNLFLDNRRFNIVEFLSKETLKYGENKYALESLAQCLISENREKDVIPIWERLVKIDYDETDITKKLAAIKEKEGKTEEAVDYYKKALLRFLKKGMYNPVEEIWLKLIELIPEDLNFFINTEKRVSDLMGVDKAAFLLSFVVPYYQEKSEYDTAIDLLKKILQYNPKDRESREELIACYREKHRDHSLLEENIQRSGLKDFVVDVHTAIDTFEKHIVFDVGNYVYHRTWGIGLCNEIKEDYLIIEFKNKPKHRMTLQMALSCLQILPKDHLWLLKTNDPKKLRETLLNDVEEGLKIVIRSKNNAATVKDFKDELTKGILTQSEWSKWWNRAKTLLKKNPYFGTLPEKGEVYFIRKKPISFDEDIYNKFKIEKNFDRRYELFRDFITHGDMDSEYIEDMLKYFTGFISNANSINENSLKSFLLLKNLKKIYNYLPIEFNFDFPEMMENIKDIHKYLPIIPENELRKSFLINMKRYTKDWPELFVKCFYSFPMKYIIEELVAEGRADIVNETITNILSHYREYTELFIWIGKNLIGKQNDGLIKIDADQAIMGYTHIMEIASRELANERNVVYNRKIFNTVVDILFKDDLLIDYVKESDELKVRRLIPTILNIDELKDEYIIKTRFAIKTAHPGIVFDDEVESVAGARQLVVTQRSYELKQNELRYLLDVEIPKNSAEIGTAMAKGDLRENAEYKYALEKQEFLKQQVKILQDSLARAQILKPEEVKTNVVSIGTMVTFNSTSGDKTEKLTILGPWESDPSKKVISYTSPIGEMLLNMAVGSMVELGTRENKAHYKILKIEKAVF